MDPITAERIKELHPELGRRFTQLDTLLEPEIVLRVTQGLRTWPQQAELYARGRTTPGELCSHNGVTLSIGSCTAHPLGLTVTKAKPGYSWHNFALALDAEPNNPAFPKWHSDENIRDSRWRRFLESAKTVGLAEGAEWRSFPDYPHLYPQELPATPGEDVRIAFAGGGFKAVWDLYPGLVT